MKLTKEECKDSLNELFVYSKHIANKVEISSLIECYERLEQLIEEYFDNPPKIDGNTSDGYHTFNELYHHRAILFSVICNQNKDIAWKSKQHNDGTMFDGMFIVGVDTPQGQYSYHYDIEPYWDMFNVKELDKAPLWDGHQPKDIDRLLSVEINPSLKFEELKPDMWVWDNVSKRYMKIYDISYSEICFNVNGEWYLNDLYLEEFDFEENRFYRREVKK